MSNPSSMPVEIKASIVDWVGYPSKPDDVSVDVRTLASVDRVFYRLCCSRLYQGFQLLDDQVPSLISALPILQRHSEHLRSYGWRTSLVELHGKLFFKESTWNKVSQSSWPWNPDTRSELFLKILHACTRLETLDIDLDPFECIADDCSPNTAAAMWCYDRNMMNKFIKPICRLASLVDLRLTSPINRPYFSETLLAEIISNLSQIQSFQCSRISASAPQTSTNQEPRQSPLGLELACLPHLKQLHLECAECIDGSWAQPAWRGSLEVLYLADCDRVSIGVLRDFTKLFTSTLVDLDLRSVALDEREDRNTDSISQTLTFEFPKLKSLRTVKCLPMEFLNAFRASKNISELYLHQTPMLHPSDVGILLLNRWPKLTNFIIWNSSAFESEIDVHDLIELAANHGINMILNGHSGSLHACRQEVPYLGSSNEEEEEDSNEEDDLDEQEDSGEEDGDNPDEDGDSGEINDDNHD